MAGTAVFASGFPIPAGRLRLGFHRHPQLEIVHHLGGSGVSRTADGQELAFAAGDTCVYPPFLRHDRAFRRAGACLVLRLEPDQALRRALPRALLAPGPPPPWLAAELAALAGPQPAEDGWARRALDHRASAVLCALLGRAAEQRPADPDEALAALAAGILDRRFPELGRLAEVAAELGVGYDRLRRVFRRQRGCSLVAHLAQVRVRRAQELLADTGLDQEEVARQCGLGSARYLNAVFRRCTGQAPGAWRRRAGAGPGRRRG